MTDSVGAAAPQFESLAHGAVSWLYVERPTELESDLLARHYNLRASHLAESLSGRPSVRALEASSYVYLALSTPVQNRVTRTTALATAGVFVGRDFVICVHRGDVRPLSRLFRECQADSVRLGESMAGGSVGLALTILGQMADPASQAVESAKLALDELGDALVAGEDQGLALELTHVERDLAVLEGVLRGARVALEALIHYVGRTSLSEAGAESLGLLRERIDRSLDLMEQTRRESSGLARAGEVLAAQRTASAARLTAVLLATMLPALVVGTLFGVSVKDVPLADFPFAFEVLLGLTIVLGLLALWQLRRRRWV